MRLGKTIFSGFQAVVVASLISSCITYTKKDAPRCEGSVQDSDKKCSSGKCDKANCGCSQKPVEKKTSCGQ